MSTGLEKRCRPSFPVCSNAYKPLIVGVFSLGRPSRPFRYQLVEGDLLAGKFTLGSDGKFVDDVEFVRRGLDL
jgi:hypothetical protein